jgi:hypothetical protein
MSDEEWWINPDDYRAVLTNNQEQVAVLPHRRDVCRYLDKLTDAEQSAIETHVDWRREAGDYIFEVLCSRNRESWAESDAGADRPDRVRSEG